jgi:hypothetical protein
MYGRWPVEAVVCPSLPSDTCRDRTLRGLDKRKVRMHDHDEVEANVDFGA